MATLIGIVSQVVGEVFAVAGDGSRRPLVEGDRVYAGEQLVTGAGGSVAVSLTSGEMLTLGRDSSMALNDQMIAGGDGSSAAAQPAEAPAAPSDSELTEAQQLQAAIEAGVDPTLEGEATAAGPGAGAAGGAGGAGGLGGGHSFVMLDAVGGALDPVIGFPTEGLNSGPEFPDAEPIATDEPAPDATPVVVVEYLEEGGEEGDIYVRTGPALVDESALVRDTDSGSGSPTGSGDPTTVATGRLVITSPDGVSALQIQNAAGVWVDVTNGGTVVGLLGTLEVFADGSWIYTLTDNTTHDVDDTIGDADQELAESFAVRVFDLDGDVSPTAYLDVNITDDGPTLFVEANTEGENCGLVVVLDETTGRKDHYAPHEPRDHYINDDGPDGILAQITTHVQGGLTSLFSVDGVYGADGAGTTEGSLSFTGVPPLPVPESEEVVSSLSGGLATNLSATDGGAISLFLRGDGVVVGLDTQGHTVLTIAIVNEGTDEAPVYQLQTTLYEALEHDNTGLLDETVQLFIQSTGENDVDDSVIPSLGLTYSVIRIDGDGDKVEEDATITLADEQSSVFSFDDDGPNAVVIANCDIPVLKLDESPEPQAGDGDRSITASFAANFNSLSGFDFGSDGPATNDSVSYSLALSADGIGSNLYALDASDKIDGIDGIGQGAEIKLYKDDNGVIHGRLTENGSDYFTIEVDTNGTVTFTQQQNIWHSNTRSDDDSQTLRLGGRDWLKIVQTLTDADGDRDSASIDLGKGVFKIEDDGPDAVVSNAKADTLTLDETRLEGTETDGDSSPAGLKTVSAEFADNFNSVAGFDYGTDGKGSVSYSLELSGKGIGSGLYALDPNDKTATPGDGIGQGNEIKLYKDANGVIHGRTSEYGDDYFTIRVGAATGTVTFTQLKNIWHGDTGNDDDSQILTLDENNWLKIVQTLTDADGDKDSPSIDLGQGVFIIQDDGPDAVVKAHSMADTLTLDETRKVGTDTDGIAPSGRSTVSASFADNFNSVAGFDYGTDGKGSVNYRLELSGNGIGSGLYALDPSDKTATPGDGDGDGDGIGQGLEINLYKDANGVIHGRLSESGADYFTISVDTNGTVTFTQQQNIWHSNTGNDDDSQTLTLDGDDWLKIVQTLTDADGDKDSASIDLGQGVFIIQDDGPDAVVRDDCAVPVLVLDESRPETTDAGGDYNPAGDASVSASFAANFNQQQNGSFDYGTDGKGSVSYSLVLIGTDVKSGLYALDPTDKIINDGDGIGKGDEILLSKDGNDIVGKVGSTEYFRISVDANGTVTFSQSNNMWHGDTGNDDDPATLNLFKAELLKIVQTLTDADGDSDSASINLGRGVFKIEDAGPVAQLVNSQADTLTLDESRPAGEGTDGIASVTANFADNFTPTTGLDYGSDGPGSVSYSLELFGKGIGSGLYALDASDKIDGIDGIGQGAEIKLYKDANGVIHGRLTENGADYFTISVDTNGTVTFTQQQNIWHSDTGSGDEPTTLRTSAADKLKLVQTLTDADGDSDSAWISLGKDVFIIQDDGPNAFDDGNYTVTSVSAGAGNYELTGNVLTDTESQDNEVAGADSTGTDGGRISEIKLGNGSWVTVDATTGATINTGSLGTLHISSDGSWTFDQTASGQQTFTFTYKLIDGDGDTDEATFSITTMVTIQPPSFAGASVTVDEDGLSGGANPNTSTAQDNNDELGGHQPVGSDVTPSEAVYSGSLGSINWGGDTGTLALSITQTALNGIWLHNGNHPTASISDGGHTLILMDGSTEVLKVTIDNNGNYVVELKQSIEHAEGDGENATDPILNVTVTATNDAGSDGQTLAITIDDDAPVASDDGTYTITALNSDATAEVSGNVITGAESQPNDGVDNDGVDNAGADGASVTGIKVSSAADYTAVSGTTTVYVAANGTVLANSTGSVGFLTIAANGDWSFNQTQTVAANQAITFSYQLTDTDGDTASASFTVNLLKTVAPTLTLEKSDGKVDEDFLAAGNKDLPAQSLNDGSGTASDTSSYTVNFHGEGGSVVLDITNGAATGLLNNDGQSITWSVPVGGQSASGVVGGVTYFTVELTAPGTPDLTTGDQTGSWTFTLLNAIKHEENSHEDVQDPTLNIGIKATDNNGGETDSKSITITIDDDMPVTQSDNVSVSESTVTGANVMFILDVSGSMGWGKDADRNPTGNNPTRLTLAKNAILETIDKYVQANGGYDANGNNANVKFQLVLFSGTASNPTTVWVSAVQPTVVGGVTTYTAGSIQAYVMAAVLGANATDYDAPLAVAQDAFDKNGRLEGAVNVSYFLSDGAPNEGQGSPSENGPTSGTTGDSGIGTNEEKAWTDFLKGHDIMSYAVGIGPSISVVAGPTPTGSNGGNDELDPIAYDGKAETNTNAIAVANLDDLGAVLGGTVSSTVTGNVLTNDKAGADGWENPTITQVVFNGTAYTDSNSDGIITITTAQGTLTFYTKDVGLYHAGDYRFDSQEVTADTPLGFTYTVKDSDGDTVTGELTITVTDSSEVYAYDNYKQAVVTELEIPGSPTPQGLADFQTTSNLASSGPSYNAWIFDTSNDSGVSGDERTVVDGDTNVLGGIAGNTDKWIVSSLEFTPYTYRVDFDNVGSSSNSFDSDDRVKITIDGVEYSSTGTNSGSNSGAKFDSAQASLVTVLTNAGFTVSHSSGNDRFDITINQASTISGVVTVDGVDVQTRAATIQTPSSSPLDASVNSGRLLLQDNNGTSDGAAQLLTPVFMVGAEGSTTLNFDYWRGNADSDDTVTWQLYKLSGDTWQPVVGDGYSGIFLDSNASAVPVTTGTLGSGQYRVYFSVNDGDGNSNRSRLELDNIRLINTPAPTYQVLVAAVLGNVISDLSHGAYGLADVTGAEGARVVSVSFNGASHPVSAVGDTVIMGDYGQLTIAANGSYTYQPAGNASSNQGESDTFTYTLAQPDGDSATARLVIGIGENAAPEVLLAGVDTGVTLSGTEGDDLLQGAAGGDTLRGLAGNDILIGGNGDDLLIGGPGSDVLVGRAGKDTFAWEEGDADGGTDRIVDFQLDINGVNSDMLDLSQLLSGVGPEDELSDYLTFAFADGSTTISVDMAGDGGPADQVIVMEGVDLSSGAYYGSTDAATIINGMLDDNALKVA